MDLKVRNNLQKPRANSFFNLGVSRISISALILPCIFVFLLTLTAPSSAQSYFTAPDTVCVGEPVNVVNESAALVYNWSFCAANTSTPPLGNNYGNPGNSLNHPKFITLIKDGSNFYTFITSPGNRSVILANFGTSLTNPPVSMTNILNPGLQSDKMRGIQVKKDTVSGFWVGFVASGSVITRMVFTGGLTNPPVIVDLPFQDVTGFSGLILSKEGNQWIGLAADSASNAVFRLRFDSSLLKNPSVDPLGNVGVLNGPTGLCLVKDNRLNYVFICNSAGSALSRLDFGTSLLNSPLGNNLGNAGGLLDHNMDISIISDCQHINGIVSNWISGPNSLLQLDFPGGILGSINASVISPAGSPDKPYGISEIERISDTVFCFYADEGNSSLSQLYFSPCNMAVPATSTDQQPGPVTYSSPGDYNIMLTIFGGVHGSGSYCKPIHVLPGPAINLGSDRTICNGAKIVLDAGAGFTNYLWSTGDTTSQITVSDSMKYWVRVINKYGCIASDTVIVHKKAVLTNTVDTTICYGMKYFAGGAFQTGSGHFTDTVKSFEGCDSILFTNLTVKPEIILNIVHDTIICQGSTYVIDATTPGASGYLWQDGSVLPRYTATQPGIYWVLVEVNKCKKADTVTLEPCSYTLTFPDAFTPNNDGLNDVFQAVGISIQNFHMDIFDRWGTLMFSTDDIRQGWNGIYKNQYSPAGVYVYEASFEVMTEPGSKKTVKGTFSLIR